MSKRCDPFSLSKDERKQFDAEDERKALAADEAKKEYIKNPPTTDELVEEVVNVLRPLETGARTRLDSKFPKGHRARAAALYLHRKVEDDLCEAPQRGGTLRSIEHGLQAKWPGIPQGDVNEAITEAQNRGLIRIERAALKHSLGGGPVVEDVYRAVDLRLTERITPDAFKITLDGIRNAIGAIDHARLGAPEAQRQLEILQRQCVRSYLRAAAVGIVPKWIDLPPDGVADRELLPLWEVLARKLEQAFPGALPTVDSISDVRVPLVGAGRSLHLSPPGRIGAWINHAAALVQLLLEHIAESTGGQNAVGIPNRIRKAAEQYRQAAEAMDEPKPTDKDAYEKLSKAHQREGAADELPDFATWSRYLRDYRRRTDGQKNKPRRGRSGRSIQHRSQL